MNVSKRGLVQEFVIGLVLLIAALGIVLFLLDRIGISEYGEDDVCKLSVLTRATIKANAQSYVPLKCMTRKICLTDSFFGGKCEQFAGEENVKTERLPSDAESAAHRIEEISAKAMYDCWNIMGQGKLDLFGSFSKEIGLGSDLGKSTCVICSRIAIDKNVNEEILKRVNINDYMERAVVGDTGLTYVQAFTNKGTSSLRRIRNEEIGDYNSKIDTNIDKEKGDLKFDLDNLIEKENKREIAFVFMQAKSPEYLKSLSNLANLGIVAAGGAFMTPVVNKFVFNPYVLIPGVIVAGGTATYAAFNIAEGKERFEQLVSAGYCGELASSVKKEDEKIVGCSLVQGVPYDFRYVNKLCDSIQGSP